MVQTLVSSLSRDYCRRGERGGCHGHAGTNRANQVDARTLVPCAAARPVLEERVADDQLRRVLVPDMVLHIELLFAKHAAVGALEARRLAAVVLVVGRHGALRGVALAAARTLEADPHLPWAPAARADPLGPR